MVRTVLLKRQSRLIGRSFQREALIMLIYDVGMHNGADTDYYLKKGARVVSIEADPQLCELALSRFGEEVAQGRLTIVNCAVSDQNGDVDFFVNDRNTSRSSLNGNSVPGHRRIRVKSRLLSDVFQEFGMPDFVKIDVEHYDHVVVRELRRAEALPAQLSVEAHNFDVIHELLKTDYTRYRMVRGNTVARRFANHRINTGGGVLNYAFTLHSSGPFGEDLPAPWFPAEAMVANWLLRSSLHGDGWYDIHAAR